MSEVASKQMTPEEIAIYRAAVQALVNECLERIRSYPMERPDHSAPESVRP